jgi:hypothetical protein
MVILASYERLQIWETALERMRDRRLRRSVRRLMRRSEPQQ